MNMWESVKKVIGTAAPMIGSLIAGKGGEMLGGMVASALGVENTPEAIENELKNNPEAMVKLAQLESDERIKLKELSISVMSINLDERKAQLKDVQDARDKHKHHWMPAALAIGLGVMVSAMFTALLLVQPPKGFEQILIMIVGAVLTGFGAAINYWLGSTKGSADKSKQQAEMLKGGKL